jgi:glyoxalase family protein
VSSDRQLAPPSGLLAFWHSLYRVQLRGLHHITAVSSDAKRNVDFYTRVLGLRLVKKTVNFDDPGTYHLYYGDQAGSPGTLLTFFLRDDLPHGRAGTGLTSAIAWSVPTGALEFWHQRLRAQGLTIDPPHTRLGEKVLAFTDPTGLPLELVATTGPDRRIPAPHPEVPPEQGIRGFHSATLTASVIDRTAAVLTQDMGYRLLAREENRARYCVGAAGAGTYVDLLTVSSLPRGRGGLGTVHHVAFRTPDDASQQQARITLAAHGFDVSPIMDRCYFHSIYFHEPNGVLFEIATDGPGFTVDEPLAELGRHLQLPAWCEPNRTAIEARLPRLD